MQIDHIDIFHVSLPLRKPIAGHDRLETVLVSIHSGDFCGWGEAAPGNAPFAWPEYAAGSFITIRDWLAPSVVGQNISEPGELTQLLKKFRGNQFAKSAIDCAYWDLISRQKGQPLHVFLSGKCSAIELGLTFDRMDSAEEFRRRIAEGFASGFSRVRLMFRPGWDIRMVEFVRREFPTQTILIDCEGDLTLGQMDMLYRLEDFMPAMIEQPFAPDDLVGSAMAQESLRTPICLDESITSIQQADMAIELRSCKYMNLIPGRVGGLTTAVAIHDLCHDNCIPCFVGAMPQTAIGIRTGYALASKANCTFPADFFPAHEFLFEDITEPLMPVRDADGVCRIHLWDSPGLGVEPGQEILEKYCIAKARICR